MRRLLLIALAFCFTALPLQARAESKEQQRAEVRTTSQSILNKLYKVKPSARGAVANAAGYGVFSNFGMKIFVAGGGTGHGMVVDKATGKETFMKMAEVQAGLGFGAKTTQVVFVFENQAALRQFVNSGWELGAQATAAITDGKSGGAFQGAASVSPGVWMYQMTDKGLAAEITAKGTKYYRNDELN
jgi:lipid-binding SYLF domain-containing protein